jgi:hypothetical protein
MHILSGQQKKIRIKTYRIHATRAIETDILALILISLCMAVAQINWFDQNNQSKIVVGKDK